MPPHPEPEAPMIPLAKNAVGGAPLRSPEAAARQAAACLAASQERAPTTWGGTPG